MLIRIQFETKFSNLKEIGWLEMPLYLKHFLAFWVFFENGDDSFIESSKVITKIEILKFYLNLVAY